MPDLLLELLSEEIPARMQARAAADLQKLVTDALVARGFVYEGARAFVTPRRLALHVAGLPAKGQDVREERKGPRVGAPEAAVQGFLKSAGLTALDQAKIDSDQKKGAFYVAVINRPGRATLDVLAEVLPEVIANFPWPKSMRWGEASISTASFRWVRPLRAIVATFGPETEEPEIVPFTVGGVAAGDVTWGHRFMAPGPIKVRRLDDYVARLEAAKVILDDGRRQDIIRADARTLAFAQGLELVEDEALLAEVAGLVEWPVVLMGEFEAAFLDVPGEAIRATIRANQKCFVLRDPGTGKLANRFIATANLAASDGGATIIAGNSRVIAARLSDARFFWETDKKIKLEDRVAKLDAITFHAKLGTQGERVRRIAALARQIAPLVGADPDLAARAALLCKADLVTEMVGEFPELQGLMGRYYAAQQGEDPAVAAAIEEHYKPQGPSDSVPSAPVSIAVALADKLDTLVGFWAIDEKPTGSKDPYALRRAALGVIRLVVENGIKITLGPTLYSSTAMNGLSEHFRSRSKEADDILKISSKMKSVELEALADTVLGGTKGIDYEDAEVFFGNDLIKVELLSFFHDRLKVQLREQGARHDLVDAVLSPGALPSLLAGEGARPKSGLPDLGMTMSMSGLPDIDRADEGRTSPPALSAHTPHPSAAQPPSPAGGEGEAPPSPLWGREGMGVAKPGSGVQEMAPDSNGAAQAGPPPPLIPPHKGEGGGSRSPVSAHTPHPSAAQPPSPARGEGESADDLLDIVRRVEALGAFLDTENGKSLLAASKRAANILAAEEKKDGRRFDGPVDPRLFSLPQEMELHDVLSSAGHVARAAVASEDYAAAMTVLAGVRPALDAFFAHVTVNDPHPATRDNRLRLLNALRAATLTVADFSKVAG